MMNEQIKLAIAYYTNILVQQEIGDNLNTDQILQKRRRQLLKSLEYGMGKDIERFYEALNEDAELQLYKFSDLSRLFVNCVMKKDIDVFTELLNHFLSDQIAVVDENKHKKIFNQLPKL